jgi:hypothetical protein
VRYQAIREIGQRKADLEAARQLLNDYSGVSGGCIREIRNCNRGGSLSDRMASVIDKNDRTRARIALLYDRYLNALNEALNELESIADVRIRTILMYRYMMDYRWNQVAKAIGGNATSDSVKKLHDRYFAKEAGTNDSV